MPLISRYSDTLRGRMTLTGNTLGFSNNAAVGAGISAFLSTNPALGVPGYPAPSTLDWTQNGSTAQLQLPPGSTVEYAELIWGGSIFNPDGSQLSLADINTPVTFKTPLSTQPIIFDPATAFFGTPIGNQTVYTRSQIVTGLVMAAGAGTYEVDGVPATLSPSPQVGDAFTTAGWSLLVVYSNPNLPFANIETFVGNVPIGVGAPPVDTLISGFSTPSSGPIMARAVVSAMQGDSQYPDDQILIGPNVGSLLPLSGPNNPVNNFFTSMINNDSGNLDTTGSFGNLNQISGVLIPAVRNDWDITNVDASANFVNSQQQAIVRLQTQNDTFAVSTLGIEIPINSANLITEKSVDKAFAQPGDTITYTITLTNTGLVSADNIVLTDPIPPGTTLVPNSTTSTAPYTGSIDTQINLTNSILPNQSVVITYQVLIGDTLPVPNPIFNMASSAYTFTPGPGIPPTSTNSDSNIVNTQVNIADLTSTGNFVKTADKAFADIGDVITYTITATNTGNVPANNVVITDTLPNGTALVPGSVTANVPFTGNDPQTGITLTNPVAPGETVTITYKVLVTQLPVPNPLVNVANINYTYTVDPANPNANTVSGTTPPVTTQVNNATIVSTKTVDKAFANVGDIITYTVTATNTGNVPANNVVLTDPIPAGTSYVLGSVNANVPFTGDPTSTINLTNPIAPGQSVTISWQVLVGNVLPNPNPVPNTANIDFTYTSDPQFPNGENGTSTTNTVNTQVNTATLVNVKTVNQDFAKPGDTLTYTLSYTNTGNVPANNVVVTDGIPNGTTFIPGSVLANVPFIGNSPVTGITLTNPINPGQTAIISYQVLVGNIIPNPNPIPNTGNVDFTYTSDPANPNGEIGSGSTNTVNTQINLADLTSPGNFVKSGDKAFANLGDIITYTITVTNTGNVAANNVVITDTIPAGTTFVPGSLSVNQPFAGNNPQTGATLLNPLLPGQSAVMTFKVLVGNTLPNPNPIPNTGTVNYTFTVDPSIPNGASNSGDTNTFLTQVNNADLNSPGNTVKTVDKAFADVGDILTYTITSTNTGNVPANNVVIIDTIPNGTSLVPGSVSANVPFTGTNPQTGLTLTNPVNPGQTVVVTFKVKVNQIPSPNPIPNTADLSYTYTVDPQFPNGASNNVTTPPVTTQVNNADLQSPGNFVKTADKAFANIGDIITYTITATNTGNVPANNVVITDTLPNGTALVAGSVTSSVAFTGNDPQTGITLTNPIAPGATVTVTFKVLVTQIPVPNPLVNIANVNYTYTVDPANPNGVTANAQTPPVNTLVNSADLTSPGNFVKTADKAFANIGDIVTYTITATNTGNVPADNVVITDTLPNGTTLVAGSVTSSVAFTGNDPQTGIALTNPIAPGATVTVTFKVLVTQIPVPNPLVNIAHVDYAYTVDPTNPDGVTASADTPPVTTQVNNANLTAPGTFTKTVDKAFADVGDILTYTVTSTNTGNVPANNVVVTDILPNGTTLVVGSVTSSVAFTGNNPETGITLTNPVLPGQTVTVTYKVLVTQIPNPNPIENTADIDYTYTVDPANPNGVTGGGTTQPAVTQVNTADLYSPGNFVKTTDTLIADVGDIITYTITATNTGNVPAANVVIVDTIPNGTTLVAGSVTGNVAFVGTDPQAGITLTNPINPGQSAIISFKVQVVTIPNPNPIPNMAVVDYDYTVNPTDPNGAHRTVDSNIVHTQVNHGEIPPDEAIKSADRTTTTPGDTITYTVQLKNTGNVPVNNVVFTDPLSSSVQFIQDTVTINGITVPNQDPNIGIQVGTIGAGQTTVLTFKALVLPGATSPILNQGTVNYTYVSDPNKPPVAVTVPTNQVSIQDLTPNLDISKAANRVGAVVGDTVVYTITVANTGDINLFNVLVKDPLAPQLTYDNSLTIDGVPSTQSIITGVTIPTLLVGEDRVIKFNTIVNSIPASGVVTNQSQGNFNYALNGVEFNGSSQGNVATVPVFSPQLDVAKSSNKNSVRVGDTFIYTITVANTGNINVDNVIVQDTIPSGFEVTNILVNGTTVAGDINTGINIGTVAVAQSSVVNLDILVVGSVPDNFFKNVVVATGNVVTDPNQPPEPVTGTGTDNTGVSVSNDSLKLVKSSNTTNAVVGDTITLTIVATNDGNVALSSINIYDQLASNLEFVSGSVRIDGVLQPLAGINAGVNIGNLNIGESTTISFDAVVLSNAINPVQNTASASYNFQIPGFPPELGSSQSNTIFINIDLANIDVNKTSDRSFVVLGDIITYTVILTNNGTVNATNVIFKDTLPTGTALIDGSFSVNGVVINAVDLAAGINIGNIAVGSSDIVQYSVRVLTTNCSMELVNSVTINFNYTLANGASVNTTTKPSETSTTTVELGISNFKQLSIEEYLVIPPQKPDAEAINSINTKIDIIKCHVAQTNTGHSTEGQSITGYKLIIHGVLKEIVEYTACKADQSVHSAHYDIPFSTFVVLPSNYVPGTKVEVDSTIEDIYHNLLDCRVFFTNATVLINVKMLSC